MNPLTANLFAIHAHEASLARKAPSMQRTVTDLPTHLQARIPQALLDLDHNTLVRRLCAASLEVIDALSTDHAGSLDSPERLRWRSKVEALRDDTLDVPAALRCFDLKRGLSCLVHSLLNHAKDLGFGPTAIRYAHAYLDMRSELAPLAVEHELRQTCRTKIS